MPDVNTTPEAIAMLQRMANVIGRTVLNCATENRQNQDGIVHSIKRSWGMGEVYAVLTYAAVVGLVIWLDWLGSRS